jgi:ribonuclease HI
MIEYILVFDGGSHGNPGRSYGSFRIQRVKNKPQAPVRLMMGYGTNNEAEYMALIAGLQALLDQLENKGTNLDDVRVEIRGDSQLVLNQIDGAWKAKDPRMRSLRDKARNLLNSFGGFRLVHQQRRKSVEALGH